LEHRADPFAEAQARSWIGPALLARLLDAFTHLRTLGLWAAGGLATGRLRHSTLRRLAVQTRGLSAAVLRDVLASDLPGLEDLELWLGSADEGWDGGPDDLTPLLSGAVFPRLSHLGLRNAADADALAARVVSSPLLRRLESLDLSLGNLTEAGA